MFTLSPRAKALFLALGIFVLGAVCGALGEHWFVLGRIPPFPEMRGGGPRWGDYGRGPGERGSGPSIRRMARDLNLTEEQQDAIQKIMSDYRERLEKVRREVGEKMTTSSQEIREKIKAVLTEEQRDKFEEMEQEWRRRRSGRGGWRGGPPRGGPGQ